MILDHLLARARVCHTADPAAFVPWFVADAAMGRVHTSRVGLLRESVSPFRLVAGRWQLIGDDFVARSSALAAFVAWLAAHGHCRAPLGETYPVAATVAAAVALQIDRAAVPWFGTQARGVHLNGCVRTAGGLSVWVARRARDKRTFPGHLDNLVAGGQPIDLTAAATLTKECHEEAGIPPALAARAAQATTIHYVHQDGLAWKPDTLTCFDLELPADFCPRPVDGEVEAFELWPVDRVLASLVDATPWKPNCALVAIDFLLRRGALDAHLPGPDRWHLWRVVHGWLA